MFPNVSHFTIIEETVLLGTLKALEMVLYPSSVLINTFTVFGGLQSSLVFVASFLSRHAVCILYLSLYNA